MAERKVKMVMVEFPQKKAKEGERQKYTEKECEISAVRWGEIEELMSVIENLFDEVAKNPDLADIIDEAIQLFTTEAPKELKSEPGTPEREAETQEVLKLALDGRERDAEFIQNIMKAVTLLMKTAPKKVSEILSVTTGLERHVIKHQEPETIMSLFEAIIEVNDVMSLGERIKKFSARLSRRTVNRNFVAERSLENK